MAGLKFSGAPTALDLVGDEKLGITQNGLDKHVTPEMIKDYIAGATMSGNVYRVGPKGDYSTLSSAFAIINSNVAAEVPIISQVNAKTNPGGFITSSGLDLYVGKLLYFVLPVNGNKILCKCIDAVTLIPVTGKILQVFVDTPVDIYLAVFSEVVTDGGTTFIEDGVLIPQLTSFSSTSIDSNIDAASLAALIFGPDTMFSSFVDFSRLSLRIASSLPDTGYLRISRVHTLDYTYSSIAEMGRVECEDLVMTTYAASGSGAIPTGRSGFFRGASISNYAEVSANNKKIYVQPFRDGIFRISGTTFDIINSYAGVLEINPFNMLTLLTDSPDVPFDNAVLMIEGGSIKYTLIDAIQEGNIDFLEITGAGGLTSSVIFNDNTYIGKTAGGIISNSRVVSNTSSTTVYTANNVDLLASGLSLVGTTQLTTF